MPLWLCLSWEYNVVHNSAFSFRNSNRVRKSKLLHGKWWICVIVVCSASLPFRDASCCLIYRLLTNSFGGGYGTPCCNAKTDERMKFFRREKWLAWCCGHSSLDQCTNTTLQADMIFFSMERCCQKQESYLRQRSTLVYCRRYIVYHFDAVPSVAIFFAGEPLRRRIESVRCTNLNICIRTYFGRSVCLMP